MVLMRNTVKRSVNKMVKDKVYFTHPTPGMTEKQLRTFINAWKRRRDQFTTLRSSASDEEVEELDEAILSATLSIEAGERNLADGIYKK